MRNESWPCWVDRLESWSSFPSILVKVRIFNENFISLTIRQLRTSKLELLDGQNVSTERSLWSSKNEIKSEIRMKNSKTEKFIQVTRV